MSDFSIRINIIDIEMKRIKYTLLLAAIMLSGILSGCNYLNIVPDETPTEKDAFANPKAAERYLYSCYSQIPRPSNTIGGIDFLTGDEVVTPFEHETFANFPKGSYSAPSPVISYWNTLFTGIRYCYKLIENVDNVPNLPKNTAEDYKAQAEFLIGYLHFLLIQNYGPTIIIDGVEDINAPVESFKARSTFDECVKFVVEKMDKAATELPAKRSGDEYGLATSVAAKSIKAKVLILAASPLFNGNSKFYAELKNPDGKALMPTTFDQNKWVVALAAAKDAVSAAEATGHTLYVDKNYNTNAMPEPADPVERTLRMALLDRQNSTEIVWGDTRRQGFYDIMPKSAPLYDEKNAYNGVSPTLNMMKRFYTVNGLPMDEDPTFPAESDWWDLRTVPAGYVNAEGKIPNFLYNREPRLYAWVGFHNGYYEVKNAGSVVNDNLKNKNIYHKVYARGINNGKLIIQMLIGQPMGRGSSTTTLRNNNYSPTGFINKKLVRPDRGPDDWYTSYIHPYVTLADLYLLVAEAAVECGELDLAKTYLDKIRTRAGIPTVNEAWAKAKHPGKSSTKEGLRDIVRQERMIETYLTNQNFWDMRRWLLAEKYFSQRPKGMNVNEGTTIEEYTRVAEVDVERRFVSPRNYLMPIPQDEINKNGNLIQNPGY